MSAGKPYHKQSAAGEIALSQVGIGAGTALQVVRVNAGATAFETATSAIAQGKLSGFNWAVASDGLSVVVDPGIAVIDSPPVVLAPTGTTVVNTSGLSASTHYYMYGYNNGGVFACEISTTAPTVGALFKTGDATRFYLGHLYTWNDAGTVRCRLVGKIGVLTLRNSLNTTEFWNNYTSTAAYVESSASQLITPGRAKALIVSIGFTGNAAGINLTFSGNGTNDCQIVKNTTTAFIFLGNITIPIQGSQTYFLKDDNIGHYTGIYSGLIGYYE